MKIIEAQDYILGRKFTEPAKKDIVRGNKDLFQFSKNLLVKHGTASRNLDLVDSPAVFFKLEPDMAKEVKAKEREEVFYSLKTDMSSEVIPAKAIFYLSKCLNLYGSLSLLPRVLPQAIINEFFSEGYIDHGYNLRDVICTVFYENYKPLGEGDLAVPNRANWDLYVEETDMVVMVPESIKEVLTTDDIRRLTVKGKDVCLGDRPIRFLADHIGAVNSTYDLRDII